MNAIEPIFEAIKHHQLSWERCEAAAAAMDKAGEHLPIEAWSWSAERKRVEAPAFAAAAERFDLASADEHAALLLVCSTEAATPSGAAAQARFIKDWVIGSEMDLSELVPVAMETLAIGLEGIAALDRDLVAA